MAGHTPGAAPLMSPNGVHGEAMPDAEGWFRNGKSPVDGVGPGFSYAFPGSGLALGEMDRVGSRQRRHVDDTAHGGGGREDVRRRR